MKNKKISVILPVYNTEKYLEKCIRSILNQSYRNIELICVDDGSTDGSGDIAKKIADEDERVILIYQENAGESAARNTGLKAATGDIWTFVDCDDWLDEDMYESLINAMNESGADISAGSWYEEFETYTNPVINKTKVETLTFDNKKLFYYIYRRDEYRAFGYMWDKIYKRECFYDENGELILFDESMKNGGDIIYLARLVENAKKAVYVDRPFYHYRQRPTSGSYSKSVKNRMGSIYAYEEVIKILEKCGASEAIGYAKRFIGYHCLLIAQTAIEVGDEVGLNKVMTYMRKYFDDYRRFNAGHPERVELFKSLLVCESGNNNRARYVVFGANYEGIRVIKELLNKGIVPIGVTDINEDLWGKEIEGLKVLPPDNIKALDFDKLIVASVESFNVDKKSLIEMVGIPEAKIEEANREKIFIWGTGEYAIEIFSLVDTNRCLFQGFLDIDTNKQGNEICGFKIYKPEEIDKSNLGRIIVSVKNSINSVIESADTFKIARERLVLFFEDRTCYSFYNRDKFESYWLKRENADLKVRLHNLPYELGVKEIPNILSPADTLKKIINGNMSLCRFGDGEFEMIRGKERPWFQKPDKRLGERLREVLGSNNKKIMIAIPSNFGDLNQYGEIHADAIRRYMTFEVRRDLNKLLKSEIYGDAYVSRFYLMYKEKSNCGKTVQLWKSLWKDRNVVLVEGKNNWTGVGNDLFEEALVINRIICPQKDAFVKYEDIKKSVVNKVSNNDLVLISLGPTATVLAYDLANLGIQAIDIGQLDNEYMWWKMGATERVEIPGKCVAELAWCHEPSQIPDGSYEREIIDVID